MPKWEIVLIREGLKNINMSISSRLFLKSGLGVDERASQVYMLWRDCWDFALAQIPLTVRLLTSKSCVLRFESNNRSSSTSAVWFTPDAHVSLSHVCASISVSLALWYKILTHIPYTHAVWWYLSFMVFYVELSLCWKLNGKSPVSSPGDYALLLFCFLSKGWSITRESTVMS